jgi:hypothetical protein
LLRWPCPRQCDGPVCLLHAKISRYSGMPWRGGGGTGVTELQRPASPLGFMTIARTGLQPAPLKQVRRAEVNCRCYSAEGDYCQIVLASL